ncbi:transposase family protein [Methylobacter tundripaludum]
MLPNPQVYCKELPDPRRETKNKLHKLEDILMIVLCSLLSGINDWSGHYKLVSAIFLTDVTHGWYFSRLPRRAPELYREQPVRGAAGMPRVSRGAGAPSADPR